MTVHDQDSLAGTPASLISGDVEEISKQYEVSVELQKNKEIFILRQKQDEESSFDSLTFVFMGKNNELKEMTFVDKLGQKTEIQLSKLKTNKKITDKKFEFEPPAGTDIIIDG
eukprot:TRINITY_DN110929_c0_g1_i1.p1 TRINITY_DN110929_c0_g1~~TRINITY_DN110929_c0_g1_i1.p1  ORF type:complete len:113 (-),score=16.10 TRINITY_DN110929_c0_g1_i1:221-559(-)